MFNKDIKSGFVLAIVGIASLFLITWIDRTVFQILKNHDSSLSVLADLRITSLATTLVIYFCIRKWFRLDNSPRNIVERKRALWLAVILICATAYFVLIRKVWVPTLTSWIDYVAFMITGLLAEELLFRGAVYELSAKTFGIRTFAKFSIPVWITSILFGLQHLGYHHYQINSSSVTQVIYTTVMGLFFCNLREASGYLWPVVLLHLLTNSFTILRNLGFV